ncbi:3-methyl-2-oxobutanoate hydroxymethyltransferase (plasmid) [Coraliomargarita sp. W4R53]
MRTTIDAIARLKRQSDAFTMVTAYDYTSARIVDGSAVPAILVGDSLGMVMQGNDSTLPVTLDEMIYHTRAVVRGAKRPLIVADLPFGTYAISDDAVRAAVRLMAEGGCQSVKLEGGTSVAPTVKRIVDAGIPVMGHLGFTPQSVHSIGLRVQGKGAEQARRLLADALALEAAGAWAIVLELVPAELAEAITKRLSIPTVGIGAGAGCNGQVQVWHDLLGLDESFVPRHARQFRSLGAEATAALNEYADAVTEGSFPAAEHATSWDSTEVERALNEQQ